METDISLAPKKILYPAAKKKKGGLNRQKIVTIISFLFLPLILLLVFSYYPAVLQFKLSFLDWDGISKTREFVGLYNYSVIFEDQDTIMTLQNNIAYISLAFVQTALALYLAIILDGKILGKNVFRSIIFMPYILSSVAIAFMFKYMYNYDFSPLNQLLQQIGLPGFRFLNGTFFDNFALAFVGMWKWTGFTMLIFLSALQSIPKDLYEAASIDGAHFFDKIRYITIPSIKTTINIVIILSINGALQAFFESLTITRGGPAGRTETYVTSILKQAFEYRDYGRASSLAFVLFVIIVTIVLVQRKFFGEKPA